MKLVMIARAQCNEGISGKNVGNKYLIEKYMFHHHKIFLKIYINFRLKTKKLVNIIGAQ